VRPARRMEGKGAADGGGDESTSKVAFWVNGELVELDSPDPEQTLLDFLRRDRGLTGTKLGCGEGGCGACTVTVQLYSQHSGSVHTRAINACLAPVLAMDGLAITTVEGIGSTRGSMHSVQSAIATKHGSQCGFCTPGIVMSMYSLLQADPSPSVTAIDDAFAGNLCRCTGYRPILEAFRAIRDPESRRAGDGAADGMVPGVAEAALKAARERTASTHLHVVGPRVHWHRPTTFDALVKLKAEFPHARFVGGNTELSIDAKFKGNVTPVLLSTWGIAEMHAVIPAPGGGLSVGGAATLTVLEEALKQAVASNPEHKTRGFRALLKNLHLFAGHQVRNVATLAGNIAWGNPISDLNPVLSAVGATVHVVSATADRVLPIREIFTGYLKTALTETEVVKAIIIPFTAENQHAMAFKQSRRREDDIAIVNAGMSVTLQPAEDPAQPRVVEAIQLCFGGMSYKMVNAVATEKALTGKPWTPDIVDVAIEAIKAELSLPTDVPGGMPEYRPVLCCSFFFKFFTAVTAKLATDAGDKDAAAAAAWVVEPPSHATSKGHQVYDAGLADGRAPVGLPLKHKSAEKQATGEAKYLDDMPPHAGELESALVLSAKPHARLVSVDPKPALAVNGVIAFFSAKDVPGSNAVGPVVHDEDVFATETVTCVGHPIGIIVATTRAVAYEAAKLVAIEYEELPVILSIEDAIAAKSYIRSDKKIEHGDLDGGFAAADHIFEGEHRIGGQEHFYLEPQGTIAVPKGEDGEMELFASTQGPTETQMLVASVLGVPANRVVCRVKRMGGGFGGKETRSVYVTTAVAVAAHCLDRPVRCILDRDVDMASSGGRHPFLGRYKVGCKKDGTITALDITLYSNAGNSTDLSNAVMDRALFHIDNVYKLPAVRCVGFTCRTNLASNTAFRGFGGPQGLMFAENWITDVAKICGMPQHVARERNFYREGDETYFGQPLISCQVGAVWDELKESVSFGTMRKEVDDFNRENRFRKRGLAAVPTKYGISFTATFLNQGGALVHIYTDGSVLLTHGGTEMGQGLHTKMIQVCAKSLGVPHEIVHISETSTSTVPNSSPTAASSGADLNGMAIVNACEQLNARLAPVRKANPDANWKDLVFKAYFDRVSLSATGFYRTPGIGYDITTGKGKPFNYFCYGAAAAVAEIDVLTGDHRILRSDIVMDVGSSLNPAIDIGQVEGAFVQGYGLFTLEEVTYLSNASPYTLGPGRYKIPGFDDIPLELNVSLLRNAANDRAVFSSKAVGEPPLFLGASTFYAIKDAIASARRGDSKDAADDAPDVFPLHSPATAERIRLACADAIVDHFPPAEGKRWNTLA